MVASKLSYTDFFTCPNSAGRQTAEAISMHGHIIVGKEGHASFKGLKLI
jgi:hypothetical protein